MLICYSRNISYYYQCCKQLCCLIFLWKLWYIKFFQHYFDELKQQIENIVLTVTFDQFKACYSFVKKKKKNHTDPKLWNGSVCPTVHPLISALHVFVLWLDSSSQKPLISSNSCAKQSLLLIGWFWLMMFPPPHPCLWWCHLKAWPPALKRCLGFRLTLDSSLLDERECFTPHENFIRL